ncbi:hypothetical protein PMKS-001875 [Pichia membranifaciens]|uniref:Dynamitin n=1 Tax=Pichia membranifaciens TaxID=4926 RepID=A0A1Q2YFU0_9ASCO|nr:hypothetical protein PMKS-001875 [Pichia membranifaciens]
MTTTDYYSENVPVFENEPEVLESFPTADNGIYLENQTSEEQIDPGLVIEENTQVKLKSLSSDFETKVKQQLLYNFTNNTAAKGFLKKVNNQSSDARNKNRMLKFTMLENELRSLMVEIETDAESMDVTLKKKVDGLIRDIDSFKLGKPDTFLGYWEEKLYETAAKENVGIKDEKASNAIDRKEEKNEVKHNYKSKTDDSDSIFLELESRISKLEDSLGYESSQGITPSIQDTIEDLYTRVNLILDGGENLSSVETEVLRLISNCETYIKDSKRIRDKSEIVPLTDRKLCLLYDKVKALPDFASLLGKIVDRFNSLNDLIVGTANSVNFLQGLEKELCTMENRLDEWDDRIDLFNSQLAQDKRQFDKTAKNLAQYTIKN